MTARILLAGCCWLLAALPARAQYTGAANLTLDWLRPDTSDGRLDCSLESDTCGPLNTSACGEEARDITVRLTSAAQGTITAGSELWVWRQTTSDCTITTSDISNDEELDRYTLEANDPLVSTADNTFDYPADAGALGSALSTDIFVDAAGACQGDGVDGVTYYVCFAIDVSDAFAGGVDNVISDAEPRAWIRIDVDTVAPPKPTGLSVHSLDGAVRAKLSAANADTYQWVVRMKPAPEELEAEPAPCVDWPSVYADVKERKEIAQGARSHTVELSASNGVVYDLCGYIIDAVGNMSEGSDVAQASPVDECDFIECYPGELQTGFCGAAGGEWMMVLVAWRVLRRRRR